MDWRTSAQASPAAIPCKIIGGKAEKFSKSIPVTGDATPALDCAYQEVMGL